MGGEERGVASFFQWGVPPRRAHTLIDRTKKFDVFFSCASVGQLFLFSPLFSFSRKGKEGVRAAHSRERSTGFCPAYLHKTR